MLYLVFTKHRKKDSLTSLALVKIKLYYVSLHLRQIMSHQMQLKRTGSDLLYTSFHIIIRGFHAKNDII